MESKMRLKMLLAISILIFTLPSLTVAQSRDLKSDELEIYILDTSVKNIPPINIELGQVVTLKVIRDGNAGFSWSLYQPIYGPVVDITYLQTEEVKRDDHFGRIYDIFSVRGIEAGKAAVVIHLGETGSRSDVKTVLRFSVQ
jgi:hypothetical protein